MTYKLKDLPLDDYTSEDEEWDPTEASIEAVGFDFSIESTEEEEKEIKELLEKALKDKH